MENKIDPIVLEQFFTRAGVPANSPHEVRQMGAGAEMIRLILGVIAGGEKTMTFSLPWMYAQLGMPSPKPGLLIVLANEHDAPELLVRVTDVKSLAFGEVSAADLAREGVPMRDPAAWRPLHEIVWNSILSNWDLAVSDDMPVLAEYFDLVYDAGA